MKERSMVLALGTDVKLSVSGSCCRWTCLRTKLTWAAEASNILTFWDFIFLTFDVFIQSSLQGGNRPKLRNTLTGWMDGYETSFCSNFPQQLQRFHLGFMTTMPASTSTARRAERVSLFKWRKQALCHNLPPSIGGHIYQSAICYCHIRIYIGY